MISLVGHGKWTAFRAFSAEVSDTVLAELGQPRRRATDDMPIGGGRDMPRTEDARAAWVTATAQATGALGKRVATLLERYGTTARDIAAHVGPKPTDLVDAPEYTEPEIDWIARNEVPLCICQTYCCAGRHLRSADNSLRPWLPPHRVRRGGGTRLVRRARTSGTGRGLGLSC